MNRLLGRLLASALVMAGGSLTLQQLQAQPEEPPARSAALIKDMIQRGETRSIDEAGFRKLLGTAEPSAMLDACLAIVREQPHYQATLVKSERVGSTLQSPPDVIKFKYQRQPRAVFCEWVDGPRKGRKVLYNAGTAPRTITAREAGFLGLMTLNLDIDSPLTRRDSNHTILELGLEFPLVQARADLFKLEKAGRPVDPTAGKWLVENGKRYWETTTACPGPPTYYSAWARLRFEVETGLLVNMEIRDKAGTLLEKIQYKDIQFLKLPPATFDIKNPAYGF